MFTFNFDPNLPKAEFYKELLSQIKSVLEGQRNWVTNLSNTASLTYNALNAVLSQKHGTEIVVNWVGFYLNDKSKPGTLFLGPFQGKVACTMIKLGKGVCGTAAATQQAQVVPNVQLFPGHIACDSASNSEIVVPILSTDKRLIGVLDIDALLLEVFDEEDKQGLEEISEIIAEACDWCCLIP